ncbi:hypothetical protein [uncultured Tateyamaria sp.]|uniref:hypothetical protein n=1 Tax=uncultured Tateyamaria sp. TaxID=455651 RepID=UPI002639B1B7|nr:hypothetical protein [uncultured Tateyamaria sp.]
MGLLRQSAIIRLRAWYALPYRCARNAFGIGSPVVPGQVKGNTMKKILTTLAVILTAGSASAASVIYDESASGDFGTNPGTDLGTIGQGVILGSIDGGSSVVSGTDEFDTFSFTLTETLNFSIMIQNEVAASSGFVMFARAGSSIGTFTESSVPASLDAGFYAFQLAPRGNEGSFDYTVQFGDVSAVPLPAGVALYAPFVLGAGAFAARRRRTKRT